MGFDFPVAPEGTIDFEAERASPDFHFDVQYEEGRVGVWYEGNCLAVIVSLPDGARERFS